MDMDNSVGTNCGSGGVGWTDKGKGGKSLRKDWDIFKKITIKN